MTKSNARLPIAVAACLMFAGVFPAAAQTAGAAEDYINPDRPGIADGSNVVGAGRFQIESGFQQEFRRDGEGHDRTLFTPTLLRLGLGKRWEMRFETNAYTWNRVSDPATGVTTNEGASPVSLGVKYHFLDTAGPRQPSLGAILRVFAPSGSGAFRTHNTTADLRLAADWDIAPKWSLNPNIGVAVYEDASGKTYEAGLFATTLNYNPSQILNFFIDTGVQSPEARHGRTSMIYDAGAAYLIGHNIQLDVSVGTGAAGSTPPHPFVAAGISKRF